MKFKIKYNVQYSRKFFVYYKKYIFWHYAEMFATADDAENYIRVCRFENILAKQVNERQNKVKK